MVSVPLKGGTVFAPLNETVNNLPSAKRNEWEGLWMMSDRRTGSNSSSDISTSYYTKEGELLNENFVLFCVFTVFEPLQLKVF